MEPVDNSDCCVGKAQVTSMHLMKPGGSSWNLPLRPELLLRIPNVLGKPIS
jgi:hypothetical protein